MSWMLRWMSACLIYLEGVYGLQENTVDSEIFQPFDEVLRRTGGPLFLAAFEKLFGAFEVELPGAISRFNGIHQSEYCDRSKGPVIIAQDGIPDIVR